MVEEATEEKVVMVHEAVTPEAIAELLRGRGFRAEITADQSGVPMIRSASSGLLFHLRFGNRAASGEGLYLDFSYVFLARVEAPATQLAADWNAGKRFARLHAHEGIIVLEMDVLLAGGVADAHILATLEIWDRLMQELVTILRRTPSAATEQNAS